MAVLSYNEIVPKVVIEYEGAPYEVLSSHVFRMQMRKPVNQTKLRSMLNGKVIEISFHQSETVKEADISTMDAMYLYTNRGQSWFAEKNNASNRFFFPDEVVHDRVQYLVPNTEVEVFQYQGKPVSISIPVKVDLTVTEASPAVKGNTAQGGTKTVTLASGYSLNVPMFINEGDVLKISTDTGEYVERVSKA